MKKESSKDYPEAEVITLALDQKEDEAKQLLKNMGLEDLERFQQSLLEVAEWISETISTRKTGG